jgi:AraC-like DNA-binding protein
MTLLTYTPRPPLSEFVELLWLAEGDAPPHAKERVLPTGTTELVIDLRDEMVRMYDRKNTDQLQSIRGPLICGPHSEFFVIDTAAQAAIMGVHFKPGGAFPFLHLPAGELHNVHVSLDTLWGPKAGQLRERLLEAKSPAARFRVLEQSLVAQADRPLVRHPAVAFALKAFQSATPTRTVADVIEQIGLSPRRLIQVFRDEVGLTPKLFCRIQRFQEVLRRLGREQPVEWANVALACGYFDQAHFIRDFRAFSGLNPTAYLTQRGEHLNHVPLCD